MTSEQEEAVKAAVMGLYDGIEEMVLGKGVAAISEAWHHDDSVTAGHPSGGWAQGWEALLATWKVFASFGREDRGGGKVSDLNAYVYGDIAYTTCLYTAAPAFGGEALACTDILRKVDGVWKVIHHHADSSPAMRAALEKIVSAD